MHLNINENGAQSRTCAGRDAAPLTGPESDFDIKVSRKVGRILTFDEVHFVSLADNFTVQSSNLLKLPLEWKTKQLNGPGNYRELREMGPRARTRTSRAYQP